MVIEAIQLFVSHETRMRIKSLTTKQCRETLLHEFKALQNKNSNDFIAYGSHTFTHISLAF
jgi:hypothetical protein